ncbi:hypothetical protein UlMin_026279 [Ulmus minor]
MMQMDKSEFCEPEAYINFSNSTKPPSIFSHNPILASSASPPLLNPASSSVSFMGNLIQKPMTPPQPANLVPPERFKLSGAGTISIPCNPYEKRSSMAAMKEMIFQIAAMQPIHVDPESIKPPKRTKIDTATMLEEATHYVKFLKKQVQSLEQARVSRGTRVGFSGSHLENVQSMQMLR